jgi:ribosomal protein S18 acetylase RimI-like enzyme
VATAGPARGLAGISVWVPGGQWFLEAGGKGAVAELTEAVTREGGGWPAKVTTSGTVKGWLRPLLVHHGGAGGIAVTREHDLLAMVCRRPPEPSQGRWATPGDRDALERYQAAYNQERNTTTAPDWDSLLRRPAVAVLEGSGGIAAVVKRTGDTARYATIGGTWTDPAHRRRGLAARLTAFVTGALLTERPAVHLVVDDDNAAAIALYRSLKFEEAGRAYMAYLSPAVSHPSAG